MLTMLKPDALHILSEAAFKLKRPAAQTETRKVKD